MSSLVRITLVGDGTSDQCLVPIVQWILDQRYQNTPYAIEYARNLPPARTGLRNRVEAAAQFYPCDVLVVHRDAENMAFATRINEVLSEVDGLAEKCVPVVPVRMTESWLMLDESAIRRAAHNPNGTVALDIPPKERWQCLPDPKETLFRALKKATDLNGRRLDKFNVHEARARLAGLIRDFSALRSLSSFRELERALIETMAEVVANQLDSRPV